MGELRPPDRAGGLSTRSKQSGHPEQVAASSEPFLPKQGQKFTLIDPWNTRAWLDVDVTWPKVDDVRTAALPEFPAIDPGVPPVGGLKFG